jgi:hypothetical protein
MNKYIKITGVQNSGGTIQRGTLLVPCQNILSISKEDPLAGDYDSIKIRMFDSTLNSDTITVLHKDTTDEAEHIAVINFLTEKITEAQQLPYEKPMLEIPADGFPLAIENVTIA